MNLKGSQTEKIFIRHLQENQELEINIPFMQKKQNVKDIDG